MDRKEIDELLGPLKKFCKSELIPKRDEMDGNSTLCRDFMGKLGQLGYLLPGLPEEYGGLGIPAPADAAVFYTLAGANPSFALSTGAHGILTSHSLMLSGSEEQKRKYLPNMVTGETIGSWAVTEPGAGSDVHAIAATAIPDGDGFILNGNKTFITNSPIADIIVVYAKTDPADKNSISGFILEKETPGVTLGPAMKKYGMEGSPTGDVYLENARVGKSQVLGELGSGFKQITAVFNNERFHATIAAAAIINHCLETCLKYSFERHSFGKPIFEFQAIQLKISGMYSALSMIQSTTKDLMAMDPRSPEYFMKVSSAKIWAGKWANESCQETMQVLGGFGYTGETDIGRFARDAKLLEIGAGTTDIQHLIIAKGLAKGFMAQSS